MTETPMEYRRLGRSGLQVSAFSFGSWVTFGAQLDTGSAEPLMRAAYAAGINFFDTADVYGDGKGETLLAQAFAGWRDEIVIATKFGYDFYNHPGVQPGQRERPHNWTPAFIRTACERSLQRLQTDRIDLYQLHNPRHVRLPLPGVVERDDDVVLGFLGIGGAGDGHQRERTQEKQQ